MLENILPGICLASQWIEDEDEESRDFESSIYLYMFRYIEDKEF